MSTFAYLVTIHNSEHCLAGTLQTLQQSKGYGSQIIAILDGCTDKSEQIVDAHSHDSGQEVIKLYTPDVHEILALNAGLRYIQEHDLASYAITVQDDTWLTDPALESITLQMFHQHYRLGHLLFRMGCNYNSNMDLLDLVDNHCSQPSIGNTLAHHQYCHRMIGCKSPSCIPMWAIKKYGLLDERLAPRGYDDIELSLRLLEHGYETMVFATSWRSDLSWGGTRRTDQPVTQQDEHNKQYVKARYQSLLDSFRIPDSFREVYNYD